MGGKAQTTIQQTKQWGLNVYNMHWIAACVLDCLYKKMKHSLGIVRVKPGAAQRDEHDYFLNTKTLLF